MRLLRLCARSHHACLACTRQLAQHYRKDPELADVKPRVVTIVSPAEGLIVKPVLSLSQLRYLVSGRLSMAICTPSLPGLRFEVAAMGSLGLVTSVRLEAKCAVTPGEPAMTDVAGTALPIKDPLQPVNR